jgi:hypothetical protein
MAADEDEVGRKRRRERRRERRSGGKTRSTRTRGGMQSAQLLNWILKAHRD